jgi:GTP cyclohydrolase I
MCEHHLLPFSIRASVEYRPQQRVLGLSKFARIVDHCSRGLQTQERITHAVADVVLQNTDTPFVRVVTSSLHLCMAMRGVKQHDVDTTVIVKKERS